MRVLRCKMHTRPSTNRPSSEFAPRFRRITMWKKKADGWTLLYRERGHVLLSKRQARVNSAFGLRLDARERLLVGPHTSRMKMGRRTIRGFVRVSPEGYRTDKARRLWLQRGLCAIDALPAIEAPRHKVKQGKPSAPAST